MSNTYTCEETVFLADLEGKCGVFAEKAAQPFDVKKCCGFCFIDNFPNVDVVQ